MKQPLQICFLGMGPSEAVESAARKKATKLETFCTDIISCWAHTGIGRFLSPNAGASALANWLRCGCPWLGTHARARDAAVGARPAADASAESAAVAAQRVPARRAARLRGGQSRTMSPGRRSGKVPADAFQAATASARSSVRSQSRWYGSLASDGARSAKTSIMVRPSAQAAASRRSGSSQSGGRWPS